MEGGGGDRATDDGTDSIGDGGDGGDGCHDYYLLATGSSFVVPVQSLLAVPNEYPPIVAPLVVVALYEVVILLEDPTTNHPSREHSDPGVLTRHAHYVLLFQYQQQQQPI